MLLVEGFDWDQGNSEKCCSHGLSVEMIESFFHRRFQIIFDSHHSSAEDRFIAVGRADNGRPIFVGFTFREKAGKLYLRPISARYMHAKEAQKYEKASSKA